MVISQKLFISSIIPPPLKLRWAGFFLILLCTASCNTVDPPPDKTELTLTLEDVSCTEAWITLKANNLQLPTTLNLIKDNTITKTITLQTADTLLYIDSLLPNTSYQYQVTSIQSATGGPATSNELSVTTLDTTSHNFTWQTWTFGEHSSSTLYDVAIVNENCIWAVGEIYMLDSLGNPEHNAYNAVHWDGQKWELKRIYTYSACSAVDYAPLKSIWAFSDTNIVVTTGAGVWWFDGSTFKPDCSIRPLLTGAINKLWGSSSSDLYAVGNAGNIAHWNGSKWTKIESGTSVDLLDVWSSPDGTVWACGYNSDYATTVLLRYDGTKWNKVYEGSPDNQNNGLYIGPISGGWTNSNYFTYILNWGALYRQDNKDQLDLTSLSYPPFFYDVSFTISGNEKNDILVSGQGGMLGHYNGVRFYDLTDLRRNSIQYLGSEVKDDLYVLVGLDYSAITRKAIIRMGNR